MIELGLPQPAATEALGAGLARALRPLAGLLWLEGPLGAGKTTLARGLLRALAVAGPIRSPTFTLVEPYDTPFGRVLHLDLYRLGDAAEFYALGLDDEPPEQALWLVEWPQRAARALPRPRLRVELALEGDARRARLGAEDPSLLQRLHSELAPMLHAQP